ncbi:MAG: hypothetical protein SFW36_20740 [Leptolyngbyaceae cyanobacterium bins.59]|nr:hypothetical protein [Leptolyngbyaceae cyanobacterium bins.59]
MNSWSPQMLLGQYLTLEDFCTCTKTYSEYQQQIDPYPHNGEETCLALQALCQYLLDPIIEHFGREQFVLTYGFCSQDLRKFLSKKDSETGMKNGRVGPSRDQHMAHGKNRNGKYYCDRLGAACDFWIVGTTIRADTDLREEWS